MLSWHAEHNSDAVAVLAPDRSPLNYRSLYHQVVKVSKLINSYGIAHNDRVAVVLPNGPEMVTAFLGVAACATCAPLNPAYRSKEFDFYLSDLNAKVLVIPKDFDSPAREIAEAQGIPIIELSFNQEEEAGVFSLLGTKTETNEIAQFSSSGDQAMVLHTSGTTSRPKLVPLT
jgi:acyl-CoA synthetase (AMP-forming)/AMP-acid ligase II